MEDSICKEVCVKFVLRWNEYIPTTASVGIKKSRQLSTPYQNITAFMAADWTSGTFKHLTTIMLLTKPIKFSQKLKLDPQRDGDEETIFFLLPLTIKEKKENMICVRSVIGNCHSKVCKKF